MVGKWAMDIMIVEWHLGKARMGMLNAALGPRGVSADDVDIQRAQSPTELRHTIAEGGILPVNPEHVVLVGIERHRFAKRSR